MNHELGLVRSWKRQLLQSVGWYHGETGVFRWEGCLLCGTTERPVFKTQTCYRYRDEELKPAFICRDCIEYPPKTEETKE